jgi:hypothetical protein
MYSIDLPWKNFNVNLQAIDTWVRANHGEGYAGASADYDFSLHFTDDVPPLAPEATEEEITAHEALVAAHEAKIQAIKDYWEGLNEESTEATSYQTAAQIAEAAAAAKAAALATAKTKLEALGLSADEVKAILGV